jgi:hypothetical protein
MFTVASYFGDKVSIYDISNTDIPIPVFHSLEYMRLE